MTVAAIPPDAATLAAALFLLLGVPAILVGVIMLYTGYVRYDAEQYLEALEELEEPADGEVTETGSDGRGESDQDEVSPSDPEDNGSERG